MLDEDERNYLRIERRGKHLVVKVGKFHKLTDTDKLLEKVKTSVSDAFVLIENDFEKIQVVKLYEKPSPISAIETLHDNKDPLEKKTPLVPASKSKSVSVLEEYYTLQIKNFSNLEDATKEFEILIRKLKENERTNLRIEKVAGYFSVRIGKFMTYSAAREFLASLGKLVTDAVIMKGKSAAEQIISVYKDVRSPEVITIEISEKKTNDDKKMQQPDSEEQKKELELLLNNVSSQYYKEDYGKAAEFLRKGIERWPNNSDLYSWYGATLLNMRFPDNALQQYRKAVELSPDVPDFHAGVGLSLVNIYMDRAKESIDAFNKALEIDSKNVGALEGLGFVYASIGKKELALELYNRLEPIDKAAAFRLYQAITQGVDWEGR